MRCRLGTSSSFLFRAHCPAATTVAYRTVGAGEDFLRLYATDYQNTSWKLLTNPALPTFFGAVLAVLAILAGMAGVGTRAGRCGSAHWNLAQEKNR